jgi:hypothetical protein
MQKYACHTASLMLVWLVFCVGVLCSGLLPVHAEHTLPPSTLGHQMHHADMADVDMPKHSVSDNLAVKDCSDDEHKMVNLLSPSGWFISFLAALAFSACIQFFPDFLRFVSPGLYHFGQGPPVTGYPPVFLTIQRLLN